MKRTLFGIAICSIWLLRMVVVANATPGDLLGSIPAPGHAPTGLAYDGKYLWVVDRLSDSLYAIDPESGKVQRIIPAPGFDPSALAWDGQFLWCADREEARIAKIDPQTGITLQSLESPSPTPQGLAWDGKNLWLADDNQSSLSQISTDDGTTIILYPTASNGTTGLTAWNGYLWCGDRRDDRIYLFDPVHGEVVFAMDAPGKYIRGLATDGKVLWSIDYQDLLIYKQVIEDNNPVKCSGQHKLEMMLRYEFRNYGPGEVQTLDAYIAVPGELMNQKIISDVKFSPQPTDYLSDRWQQKVAHFRLANLPIAQRQEISMTVTCELADARWYIYPNRVGSLKEIPQDIKDAYLVDEDKYRINDPVIQKAVKEAIGDEQNPYWIMRKIHKYIRDHLHYELAGGWNVAPQVLTRGNGSCSEYTFLFISMCRAAGLPARYVGSVVIRGDEASTDEYFHRWSQVYLPGCGWIHVDPQGGDSNKPSEVAASIGNVTNRFLITTGGGGASEYLGWNYNYDQRWTSRGPVKIVTKAVGEWSPAADVKNLSEEKTSTDKSKSGSGTKCELK